MSIKCIFELNNRPMSLFKIGAQAFPAFSGEGNYVNKKAHICLVDQGPIPIGRYFIVDRQSGGKLGWFWDLMGNRGEWFALYAQDGRIDDYTFCEEVRRGSFRLHPKVGRGISKGCVTIDQRTDFNQIATILKAQKKRRIPGSDLCTYGEVMVL